MSGYTVAYELFHCAGMWTSSCCTGWQVAGSPIDSSSLLQLSVCSMALQAALIAQWGLIHLTGLYSRGEATPSGIEVMAVEWMPCFPRGAGQLGNMELGIAGVVLSKGR